MPAYILETGRSFKNPIDSQDYKVTYNDGSGGPNDGLKNVPANYKITFDGEGEGGYRLGKDEVFYIGEKEEICLPLPGNNASNVTATFDSNGNIVCTGTGNATIQLDFAWSDNPNTAGTALGTYSVGGITFTQGSNYSGTASTTINVEGGQTYNCTITQGTGYGGFTVQDSGTKLCFKDSHGSDCNARVYIVGVGNTCGTERTIIYRYYSGKLRDHAYYPDQAVRETKYEHRSYNREPRQKSKFYFAIEDEAIGGTTPLYSNWDGTGKDTYLTTGSGQELLGYIFTSEAAAVASGTLVPGESVLPLHEYLAPANYKGPDHFYTLRPQFEVNLETGVPGVADPGDPMNEEYQYVGIVGYVMTSTGPRKSSRIIEVGRPHDTGEVNRTGWYDWDYQGNGTFTEDDYLLEKGDVPCVKGWGDPDNAEILTDSAHFEWFYGKNGAVKASVPKFLGFHDAFEGQFVYYLYDTTYPWNGPIYGINMVTSDANCCQQQYTNNQPCIVTRDFKSFNYTIKESVWRTKKTRLFVDVPDQTPGGSESFWTCGTDDHRLFFRYTTSTGFFAIGERINGWMITAVRYFGDEMNCGYMELTQLQQEGNGNAFVYNNSYTSQNSGTIIALAGFGIQDKGAVFGVYEFPKKVAYTRVNVDPDALIPQRTIDVAEIHGLTNAQGKLESVQIINAGSGYKAPEISIEIPEVLRDQGFIDPAKNINESFTDDSSTEVQIELTNTLDYGRSEDNFRQTAADINNQQYVTESDFTGVLRQAKVRATVDNLGCIDQVIIEDAGDGYPPNFVPRIIVVDRESDTRVDTFVGEANLPYEDEVATSLEKFGGDAPDANQKLEASKKEMQGMFEEYNKNKETSVKRGYLTMTDTEPDEKTRFCGEVIPNNCFQPNSGVGWTDWAKNWDEEAVFGQLRTLAPDWNTNNEWISNTWKQSAPVSSTVEKKMSSGMAGIYPSGCVEVGQPKMYQVRRFFDIPCPYTSLDENGDEKVFGYMPFKYCGSKREMARIRISIQFEGDVSGAGEATNTAFLNFLKSMGDPATLRPRVTEISGEIKNSHPCSNGQAKGRCYESSPGQYTFAPIGGDEQTYDYGITNMSELEQFETWAGAGNYTGWGTTTITQQEVDGNGQPTGQTNEVTYNSVTLASCSGGKFPNPCWHNFVVDGVLDVNAGYDSDGNPIAADNPCSSPPVVSSPCGKALEEVTHAAIAVPPKLVNAENHMEMGPYEGSLNYRNWGGAGATLLDDSLNTFGNPYFDECDLTFDVK